MPAQPPSSSEPAVVRTCIGCRRREDQSVLVRLALEDATESRSVTVDLRRRMPGRGAWLHPDADCLQTALNRRAFARAFRGPVDTDAVSERFERSVLDRSVTGTGSHDAPAPNTDNESGSET